MGLGRRSPGNAVEESEGAAASRHARAEPEGRHLAGGQRDPRNGPGAHGNVEEAFGGLDPQRIEGRSGIRNLHGLEKSSHVVHLGVVEDADEPAGEIEADAAVARIRDDRQEQDRGAEEMGRARRPDRGGALGERRGDGSPEGQELPEPHLELEPDGRGQDEIAADQVGE